MTRIPEQIFELEFNGLPVDPSFRVIPEVTITSRVRPYENWPKHLRDSAVSGNLVLFETPIENYENLDDGMNNMAGKTFKLGELATYSTAGAELEFIPTEGNIYDLFCVAKREDGSGAMCGGARYARTSDLDYQLDNSLTLEEAQFFAYSALGLTKEEANSKDASLIPMTAWSDIGITRFIIAGFKLLDDDKKVSVTVDHLGRAEGLGFSKS